MKPSVLLLFLTFFRHSGLSLGLSAGLVAPLRRKMTEEWELVSPDEFDEMTAFVQGLPGVFSLNYAVRLGHRARGWAGAGSALLGVLVPSLLAGMLAIALLHLMSGSPLWDKFWMGARPAVLASFLLPCLRLGQAARLSWSNLWYPLLVAVVAIVSGISPFLLLLLSGVVGFVIGRVFRSSSSSPSS